MLIAPHHLGFSGKQFPYERLYFSSGGLLQNSPEPYLSFLSSLFHFPGLKCWVIPLLSHLEPMKNVGFECFTSKHWKKAINLIFLSNIQSKPVTGAYGDLTRQTFNKIPEMQRTFRNANCSKVNMSFESTLIIGFESARKHLSIFFYFYKAKGPIKVEI